MNGSSSTSRVKMLRFTTVALALTALLACVVAGSERFAGSRGRLASHLAGSLVLFVVEVLREMRTLETMVIVMAGVLAVGVLIGVAVEASSQRESGQRSRGVV